MATIVVTPAGVWLDRGKTQQFSAVLLDDSGSPVGPQPAFDWSVSPAVGSVDQNGLYTTPPVTRQVPTSVTVAPDAVSLLPGQTQTFKGHEWDQDGKEIISTPPVTVTASANGLKGSAQFVVSPQLHFSWASFGVGEVQVSWYNPTSCYYVAGDTPGAATVAAVVDGLMSPPASVTVEAVVQVPSDFFIQPGTATLYENGTQQFAATMLDQFGQPMAVQPAVGWSAVYGTVDGNGLYTAPPAPASDTVYAATADGTFSDEAYAVVLDPSIVVRPAVASVVTGGRVQFSALELDDGGNLVLPQPTINWSCTGGGSISKQGVYAAPGSPAVATVFARGNGLSGVASVTVMKLPAAPSALTAKGSAGQVALKWKDNGVNEAGFVIRRSGDNKTWGDLAVVVANVTAYADTGLPAGRAYYYRVAAFNGAGRSGYSNTASAAV